MPTFTPAQHDLYNDLRAADRNHVAIVRDIMTKWLATGLDGDPDPEGAGAPVDTPAWTDLEDAFVRFEDAAGGGDEAVTRAALDVTDAVVGEAATRRRARA